MKKLVLLLFILFISTNIFSQNLSDYTFGQSDSTKYIGKTLKQILFEPILPISLKSQTLRSPLDVKDVRKDNYSYKKQLFLTCMPYELRIETSHLIFFNGFKNELFNIKKE